MKNTKKKRPKSLRAMTVRLAAGTLAVWLVCMAVMTLSTAQMLFDRLMTSSGAFPEYSPIISEFLYYDDGDSIWEREEETPGYQDYLMLRTLANYRSGTGISDQRHYFDERYGGDGISQRLLPLRDESVPMETAILFTDADGNILHEDGDFLAFEYVSEETWETHYSYTLPEGYGWIDLNDETDERFAIFREWYEKNRNFTFIGVFYLRITGVWDGQRMEPVKMDYIDEDMRDDAMKNAATALSETENGEPLVDGSIESLLKNGFLSWKTIFDDTANVAREELVTIYADRVEMSEYAGEGSSVVWDQQGYWEKYGWLHGKTAEEVRSGVKYESLKALLKDITLAAPGESWGNLHRYCGLDETIVLNKRYFHDTRGYDPLSGDEYPEPQFYMTTAIRSHPLRSAVMLLRNVYIGTFLLALLVFWRLRQNFRENLLLPAEAVSGSMEQGYRYPHEYQNEDPVWEGGYALVENYKEMREQLRIQQNEITRLETALNYAKAAEAKRRQMTSNIAHELKTPLAVVHSYAEGLQEHIAEEKREQYLQTILSETERMDAMVLEMLDLSRLEAGKVKLARDEFDLAALAKSVFEALSIKAEEKRLEVTLELDGPVMMSADESRIRQVIENYASNAVKYTPEGGKVTAKLITERGKTVFVVENECAPLSAEALSRIWDSFYRVDDSRTGRSGTGLGLAIAKSIVELHGGSVGVRNTETGVEFRFTL